jgi:hypothetical protein
MKDVMSLAPCLPRLHSLGLDQRSPHHPTLIFLAPVTLQAKTKGLHSGVDIGVKYSEKQQRNFDDATMKAGQCVIGLQVGTSPLSSRVLM